MAKASKTRHLAVTATKSVGKVKIGVLSLNLYREYFDAIQAGTKKVEYRQNTAYWRRRLVGRKYHEVHFRNGYAPKAPFMRVQFKGLRKIGRGRASQFAIRLGKVLEVKHYQGKRRSR